MPVDVQIVTHSAVPDPAAIETWALAALDGAAPCGASAGSASRPRDGEVCVRVVDEPESRALNREFRHKDAPTNVLSFPAAVDLPDTRIWGDVVVCAGVVARECREQDKGFDDHFAHMVVHGVLHLLGYDHETDAEASVMERLETEILAHFGVSDPYGEG